ncbi:hypothetical protein Noda2021_08970 [Candidatus Dependentiae bacterium Noda2021]|nr:hypothetical protein Noda2021_08970 [Candidatus Dependentiae bacterium Noda2021]
MKSVWEGSISFGLVSIPIRLYSAVRPHAPGFQLLCATCKEPVRYKRWCEHCNKEISWDQTVKGIKLKDGSYFIITPENLKKLKPEKTDTISIDYFIDVALIPFIYLDSHYYTVPVQKHEKAYQVLLKAMGKTYKAAVGTFVMHEKDHVCIITAYDNVLLLTTLNYKYEIKEIPAIKFGSTSTGKELTLAQQLITQLSHDFFDISSYKNSFLAKLVKAIKTAQTSKKTKKVSATKKIKAQESSENSLITALESSVKKPIKHKQKTSKKSK